MAARAAAAGRQRRRALLVVLPLVRADHVEAFKDGEGADTPNLDDLTGDSLRFDRAIPECMPALPVRRTLITGHALVPVPRLEAHRRHAGRARLQPGVGLAARDDRGDARRRREGDLRDRQPDRVRAALPRGAPPGGRAGARARRRGRDPLARSPRVGRATDATERTFKAGIAALDEVKDEDSFFVAVDPFDPVDAVAAPPIYVRPGVVEKDGIGPMSGRLVELDFSDGDTKPLRSAYRDHVEEVDDWVGRLLDEVPDDTLVYVLGDIGIALGDHAFLGRGTPDLAPPLVRDPVPDPPPGRRRRAATAWTGTPPPTTCPPRCSPTSASRSRARCAART